MTFDQAVTALLDRLKENPLSPVFWTRGEVHQNLKDVILLWAWFTWPIVLKESVTISGGAPIHMRSLLPSFMFPLRVQRADGSRITPSSLSELEAESPTWSTEAGPPRRYHCAGDLWTLYPGDGAVCSVTYVAEPQLDLTSTIPAPDNDLEAILAMGKCVCRFKQGGEELAQDMPAIPAFIAAVQGAAMMTRELASSQQWDVAPIDDRVFQVSMSQFVIRQKTVKDAQR